MGDIKMGSTTEELMSLCAVSGEASTKIVGIKQDSESNQEDLDDNNANKQEYSAKLLSLHANSEDSEASKNQGVRAAVPGSEAQGVRVTVPGNQGVEAPSYENQGVRANA